MSRGLTSGMVSAAAAKEVRPALACFMDFASGPLRVWTGLGNKTWAGNVYTGVGTLGGVSPIEETKSVAANGITMTLSGVPSDAVSLALLEHYRGRKIYIWLWLFDTSNALISDPVQIFAGRMDTMTIQDTGENSTISVAAESRLVDLRRSRERRFTDGDQKQLFPGDRGFEFQASLQSKDWPWGRASNVGAATQAPPDLGSTYYQD